MAQRAPKPLTSKQLLEKIGLTDGRLDPALTLDGLGDEGGLDGDLVPLLLDRFHQLTKVRHDLQPGIIVGWKPGLRNRKWPRQDEPAVVVERLPEPVFDTDETGSTYFREPLDVILGVFIDTPEHRGDFLVFHANSQRYQPWPNQGQEQGDGDHDHA